MEEGIRGKSVKKIIIDLDGTIAFIDDQLPYSKRIPNVLVIDQLRRYWHLGFKIVVFTSRNMRTFGGEIGKINKYTLPEVTAWLDDHNVPYDEIIMGKPWCGHEGFYVDDKTVRPSEFMRNSLDEIYKEITT